MLHAEQRQPPANHAKGSLAKSLVLHVVVVGLIVGLPHLHRPPEVKEPPAMQAVLVQSLPPQPVPEIKPVAPPPEPALPEPQEIEPPPPVKEPSKIALPKKPEPKPAPEPAKPIIKKPMLNTAAMDDEFRTMQKELQQEQMRRQMEEEFKRSATAMRASANVAIVDQFKALITQRLVTRWNRPLSARRGMEVTLRISMLPGGEVTSVVATSSSGDAAFDASAEEAVRRASPLPVPEDPGVFNQHFRVVALKFKPEDL